MTRTEYRVILEENPSPGCLGCIGGWLIIGLALVGILFLASVLFGTKKVPDAGPKPLAPAKPPAPVGLQPGSRVVLFRPDGTKTVNLYEGSKIWPVPIGTLATVIAIAGTDVDVRILEGEHKGRAGRVAGQNVVLDTSTP